MAERDTTPVTIYLDRKRPYRLLDSDRDAVWVGPGEATVPRWVAMAWGMEPTSPAPTPTTEPPAQVSAPLLLAGLGLSDEQVAALQAAGISDRAALATALEANGDKGYAGLSRTQVRALRKQLEG